MCLKIQKNKNDTTSLDYSKKCRVESIYSQLYTFHFHLSIFNLKGALRLFYNWTYRMTDMAAAGTITHGDVSNNIKVVGTVQEGVVMVVVVRSRRPIVSVASSVTD